MAVRGWLWVVLCAGASALCGCARSTDGPDTGPSRAGGDARVQVELDSAKRSDFSATVELVGSLLPRRRTVIVAEVDGIIQEIPASARERIEVEIDGRRSSEAPRLDIGVEVTQGDLLVQLEPTEYQLALDAAQARLAQAEKGLLKLLAWQRPEEIRSARAASEEAKARLELAQSDLERAKSLVKKTVMSRSDYERSQAEARMAEAGFQRAEAALGIAEAGPTEEDIAVTKAVVVQAEAELKMARWKLAKTTIRAPYDAVVTDRYVDEGDRVTAMPRVEIMELMDLSILTAQLGVPERYVNEVHVGDRALVQIKGSTKPVPGLVVLVNDKVDPANRTFRIRVAVENRDRRLKVGQFAQVNLRVNAAPQTLTIPARAVAYTGGQPQVFVYANGRVQQRAVELGLLNQETVEVLSGLKEGERVVVVDPAVLSDGMPVRVKTPASRT